MKLALVIYGALDRRSGGYSYDTDLVAYLRQRGHELAVHAQPEPPARQGRVFDDWYQTSRDELDLIIYDELVFPSITKNLQAWRSGAGRQPLWVALVHHLRASEQRPAKIRPAESPAVERRFLGLMDGFICNSLDTCGAVQSLVGSRRQPWVLARPPVWLPEAMAERAPAPDAGLRLLFVGNLIPRKNLHGLLAALARIAASRPELPWRLEVVGNPDWDPAYAAACAAQAILGGIQDRVAFCGAADRPGLELAYARSDLLAVPSWHEGWGMVYIEAMARGLVPLGGHRGGAVEAIGNAGLLVDPDDPAAIAASLIGLLEHPGHRELLRARGAARVEWLCHGVTGFARIPAFLGDLADWARNRQSAPAATPRPGPAAADFSRYLESKISVEDRSLHPRILDGLRGLPPGARVLDLGGGTGSMARRLRARGVLAADCDYLLVDSGAPQLALAQKNGRSLFPQGRFDTENADVELVLQRMRGQQDRGEGAVNLVIAHALLDLFDPGGFAHALASIQAERYLLSHIFDGQTAWSPVIDAGLDQEIVEAYHRSMDERHQSGGAGSSRSGQAWLEALPRAGLAIADVAAADWLVRPVGGRYVADEAHFLACMLGFFADSLRGRTDLDQDALDWWLWRRHAQLARGELGLSVHHVDILAVPMGREAVGG